MTGKFIKLLLSFQIFVGVLTLLLALLPDAVCVSGVNEALLLLIFGLWIFLSIYLDDKKQK